MKEIRLHHKLADIHIRPLEAELATQLKQVIRTALNEYLKETILSAAVVHEATQSRHSAYYQTPGYYLRLYRHRASLSQAKLAKRLDIYQHHLSEMEHNKRSIGKKLAMRLGKVLKMDYRKFL